uniref:Uncharacterized protein n=1 Tax=Oryza glaberrima TaxID=4538 RepID=I1QLA9_ORYGL
QKGLDLAADGSAQLRLLQQDRDNDDYYSKGYNRAWVRRICFHRGRERWIHHRWAQECQIRCHRAREGRIHHPWAQDVGSDGG